MATIERGLLTRFGTSANYTYQLFLPSPKEAFCLFVF